MGIATIFSLLGGLSRWLPQRRPASPESASILTRARSTRRRRHLSISPIQQRYKYSCCAAVMQVANHFLTGKRLSHEKAICLTGCRPNGATFTRVARCLSRLSGATCRELNSLAAVRRAIDRGHLVLACDNGTYEDAHAVLFCGVTRAGIYVFDPASGHVRWRHNRWVAQVTNEFFCIEQSREVARVVQKWEK